MLWDVDNEGGWEYVKEELSAWFRLVEDEVKKNVRASGGWVGETEFYSVGGEPISRWILLKYSR